MKWRGGGNGEELFDEKISNRLEIPNLLEQYGVSNPRDAVHLSPNS